MPKLSSGDPRHCDGFSVIFPDRLAEVEKRKQRLRDQDEKAVLNRIQAALFLNISLSTLDRLTKAGQIPYLRIGDRILYKKNSLLVWLSGLEVRPKVEINAR